MLPTQLTQENIVGLVNAEKLYIENGNEKPVGDMDHEVLFYAESYTARKATLEDLPVLMKFIGFSVYLNPDTMPESTFAEGITA